MNLKKSLVITGLMLLGFHSRAQLPTDQNGNIVFTEVIEVKDKTKKQLYDKAKLWIVSTLKSGDNMVGLGGNNSDQIVGTGNLSIQNFSSDFRISDPSLNFKFIVFIKDGRYKYELSNTLFSYYHSSSTRTNVYRTSLTQIKSPLSYSKKAVESFKSETIRVVNENLTAIIKSFKENMITSNDDW